MQYVYYYNKNRMCEHPKLTYKITTFFELKNYNCYFSAKNRAQMQLIFSNEVNGILSYSKEEAMRLGSYFINTDHMVLGILRHRNNRIVELMRKAGVDLDDLKADIENAIDNNEIISYENEDKIVLSKPSENALKIMFLEARALKSAKPDSVHLMLAILRTDSSKAQLFLEERNITYDTIKEYAVRSANTNENITDKKMSSEYTSEQSEDKQANNNIKHSNRSSTPVLESFGYDLTKAAADGKLDPVVGREKEIERLAQILGRRKKNNPVLIGEPGVGKSAIAEALAIRISQGVVSPALQNKKLISLDIGSIVAGTKYRGQFEERMKAIINELSSHPEIIIFIDEMHTLIGAGGSAGSLDAANMLKPALARGEIQCIGTTTLDEYRQFIEKDGALERRFQKIMVEPTNFKETLSILESIKGRYERHHNAIYTDEALKAAIRLSERYITDRNLPDKAIDVMDEAGSRAHLKNLKIPKKLTQLEKELEVLKANKKEAVDTLNFEKAAMYRDLEKERTAEIEKYKKNWEDKLAKTPTTVTEEDIAIVLSMSTNIPVNRIAQSETNKLLNMGQRLKELIIGQDDAVDKVTKAIQRNRAGLKDPNKPIGTFLFLGPTGVGKTQLAKVLAQYMFDSADNLIRIDMSEYMEKYSVSRLIGAPPGYVGYNDGGQLSERVRHKPYSVVLLDEVEKAHPDIFNLLLQVLDEGRLTDSTGKYIDFRNTVLILTSNIGTKELKDFGSGLGFATSSNNNENEASKKIIDKALKKAFTPEFLNRLDEQITFNKLTKDDIAKIIDIELKGLYTRVEEAGYKLKITPQAKRFVAEVGYDSQFGARPLKRAIQKYVEDPLAEKIISGSIKSGDIITVGLNKERNCTRID